MDSRLFENMPSLFSMLRRQFDMGVRSPFFYVWGSRILNSAPDMLRSLGPMEIQILYHCAGMGLVEKPLHKSLVGKAQHIRLIEHRNGHLGLAQQGVRHLGQHQFRHGSRITRQMVTSKAGKPESQLITT